MRGSAIYNNGRSPTLYNCLLLTSATLPGAHNEVVSGENAATVSVSKRMRYHSCRVGGFNTPGYSEYDPSYTDDTCETPHVGFVSATADDFRPAADSPLIGAGCAVTFSDPANCDLDGNPRPAKPTIGCYEYNASYVPTHKTIYVATDGDDSDGSSWAKAYRSPVKALALAPNGADVLVGEGEYALAESLELTNAVRLIGVEGRDKTTLTASAKGYRIARLANARAVIKGFTIKDGDTTSYAGKSDEILYNLKGGAGVAISYAGGELTECRITGCCDTGSTRQGAHDAAGLVAAAGYISRCIFDNNTGNQIADLVVSSKGVPEMDDCLFTGNTAPIVTALRTLMRETWSSFYNASDRHAMRNCTFVGNGETCAVSREVNLARVCNCIILNDSESVRPWSDTSDGHATNATDTAWRNNATTVSVGTNCVVGTAKTLKVKSSGKLFYSSPCRDAGYGDIFATEPLARDVDGAVRVSSAKGADAVVDIGAYERQGDAPPTVMLVR